MDEGEELRKRHKKWTGGEFGGAGDSALCGRDRRKGLH